ncbi:MAG: TraB/GumN family protein [Bacteroidia bacterium]
MKKAFLIASLMWAFSLTAQNTFLYEISGNGLPGKSYLFGTIHTTDEAVYNWNDSVLWAINQCPVAAFELDMDANTTQSGLISELNPESNDAFKAWIEYFVKDISPAIEKTIKPDTLANRLIGVYFNYMKSDAFKTKLASIKSTRSEFVDLYLQNYARHVGKNIIGLETVSDQLNIFLNSDKEMFKNQIVNFLEKDNWNIDLSQFGNGRDKLINSYAEMNMDELCGAIAQGGEEEQLGNLYNRIFTQRNATMFTKSKNLMQYQPCFVAVGSGHLCNESGLLNQFKMAGYTVRPISTKNESNALTLDWVEYENNWLSVKIPKGVSHFYFDDDNYEDRWEYADSNLIYTPLGKLSFNITKSINYDYSEELEEEYMEDYEEVDDEYYGDATESWDDSLEFSEDEVAYESMYDSTEYEYSDYDYSEYETEYNYDMDEKPKLQSFFDGKGRRAKKSKKYWNKFGEALQAEMVNVFSEMLGSMSDWSAATEEEETIDEIMEELDTPEEDALEVVEIMGKEYAIESISSFFSNSKKVVVVADEYIYELSVDGDERALESNEVLEFFKSFDFILKQAH